MPLPNSKLDGFTVQQIGAMLGRVTPDQLDYLHKELLRRYKFAFALPAQPAWERDEWTELIFQGRAFRFFAQQIAAAAGNLSLMEVSNGLDATATPTGKAILVKRVRVANPAGAGAGFTLRHDFTTGLFAAGTVVGPATMRGPGTAVTPTGSFPPFPTIGGNGGANCRTNNILQATVNGGAAIVVDRQFCALSSQITFEIPGALVETLMDAAAAGVPAKVMVVCDSVNTAFDAMMEVAEVDINSY